MAATAAGVGAGAGAGASMMEAFPPLPPSQSQHPSSHPQPLQQQSHSRQPSFAERQRQQDQQKGHQRRGSSPEKGQSRFQEGSMNDRVSAVPPPEFITGNKTEEEIREWERQFYFSTSSSGGGVSASTPASPTMGSFGHGHPLMRPRSILSGIGSGGSAFGGGGNNMTGGGVTQKKSSGFLAPLWDGVREKLRGSRSSGSMEGVMQERVNIIERAKLSKPDHYNNKQREASTPPSPTKPTPGIVTGAANGTSYPSREEVLESYKTLQASGFFNAHAIKGTRHPLRNAASAPMTSSGYTVPAPIAVTGTMSPPSGPSSPTSLYVPGDRRSFADRLAAVNSEQQLRPAPSISNFHSPPPPTRAPPPPPPPLSPPPKTAPLAARSSEEPEETSPSRGVKRPSQDIHGEQETATRKLVKKLRRSNSRTSTKTNFTTATTGHINYHNHRSRPSTSSAMSGFSLFGGASLYTTTSTILDPDQTPTQSPSKSQRLKSKMSFSNLISAKLSKEKNKEKKERSSFLGGLRRRNKGLKTPPVEQPPLNIHQEDVDMGMGIPAQVATHMVTSNHHHHHHHHHHHYDDDDDEMMLDAPYITPHPTHYHVSNPHPHLHPHHHIHHQRGGSLPLATLSESSPSRRNITPPTSAFYTSHSHQPRIRRSLEMELENEVIVPDQQRGIPKVPKIPRSFVSYGVGRAVVVDIEEERRVKRESLQVLMGKRERKQHRDSGMSGFSWGSGGGVRSVSGMSGGSSSNGVVGQGQGQGQENEVVVVGGVGEVYVHPSQSGW